VDNAASSMSNVLEWCGLDDASPPRAPSV
jgi:hypothetical protein